MPPGRLSIICYVTNGLAQLLHLRTFLFGDLCYTESDFAAQSSFLILLGKPTSGA